ncbi:hypothetical protein SU60_13275 [Vibrio mytili]|uniref:Uncharacterized protein n=1 Tax=Vibrio mytili TaxID=50718 RepID=A0A0C3E839_9VIBR|nr:hypothetical protein SU60_13275 [Vibrio mytili]
MTDSWLTPKNDQNQGGMRDHDLHTSRAHVHNAIKKKHHSISLTTLAFLYVEWDCWCILILFHPDYNRRLWHLTRSADLDESSARGLTQKSIPPVGNFAPP